MFNYNPSTGLNDVNSFPTTPDSEGAARSQFMTLFNQLKDYLNTNDIETTLKKAQFTFTGDITAGRIEFPIGDKTFMLQWGTVTTGIETANGTFYYATAPITFSKAFPTKCIHLGGTQSSNTNCWVSETLLGLSTGTIVLSGVSGATNNKSISWFAIGY